MNIENQLEYTKSLLVIDDEVEITKSLFRQFRKKYNVFVANSAEEALPILEKEDIQVVLSDQRMPGMTGISFFNAIKSKYPDALKLILTGYSDIDAVIGAINEGQVFRYLTKPWNPAELNLSIEEAFDRFELIRDNKVLYEKLKQANLNLENKVLERTQALEIANENLIQLNIQKNKYVGIVAHDLRSPILSAELSSNLLIVDFDDFTKTEHLDFLKIINERCSFALNLIGSFLDASKIESGLLDLNLLPYNYCEFAKACIDQNLFFAQRKSQEIIFSCDCMETEYLFDKNKMEQVLNNLLSNAIKYSHAGKKVWVNVQVEQHRLLTQVKDEGQGIPENELESIFVAYKTASVKSTNNEKSTGLGLAIVKKIIEAHNGSISVESKPNVGSIFTFSLPIT